MAWHQRLAYGARISRGGVTAARIGGVARACAGKLSTAAGNDGISAQPASRKRRVSRQAAQAAATRVRSRARALRRSSLARSQTYLLAPSRRLARNMAKT